MELQSDNYSCGLARYILWSKENATLVLLWLCDIIYLFSTIEVLLLISFRDCCLRIFLPVVRCFWKSQWMLFGQTKDVWVPVMYLLKQGCMASWHPIMFLKMCIKLKKKIVKKNWTRRYSFISNNAIGNEIEIN